MSKECHPTAQEYHKQWAQKLRPTTPPPFKPPHVSVKPKRKVKRINWCLPGLYSIAQFLREVSPKGPHALFWKKFLKLKLSM